MARTVAVHGLTPTDRDAMWRLFRAYYADVDRARFDADLSDKTHVIIVRDTAGAIRGFSTLLTQTHCLRGRVFVATFSGDTILDNAFWGNRALQHAFGRYITRVKLRHPFTPVYWFLISKGYKTYLLLSRNFPRHWPRHDAPTPEWEQAVLDHLARARFAEAWDPERGVILAGPDAGHLRVGVAPVVPSLLEAPDVRFFVERNPGHADGDELACLGEIRLGTWSGYMGKQVKRLARRALRPRARDTQGDEGTWSTR